MADVVVEEGPAGSHRKGASHRLAIFRQVDLQDVKEIV